MEGSIREEQMERRINRVRIARASSNSAMELSQTVTKAIKENITTALFGLSGSYLHRTMHTKILAMCFHLLFYNPVILAAMVKPPE